MKKMTFFSSPIGLGHVTRDSAIVQHFPEISTKFVTGNAAAKFLKQLQFDVEDAYIPPQFIVENGLLQKTPKTIDNVEALKLIERVERIELHAHTYAFYLNLQHGTFDIFDFCAFASENNLQGVSIHIDAGNDKSTSNYSPKKLRKLKNYLESHNLNINIEASSTSKKVINNENEQII